MLKVPLVVDGTALLLLISNCDVYLKNVGGYELQIAEADIVDSECGGAAIRLRQQLTTLLVGHALPHHATSQPGSARRSGANPSVYPLPSPLWVVFQCG